MHVRHVLKSFDIHPSPDSFILNIFDIWTLDLNLRPVLYSFWNNTYWWWSWVLLLTSRWRYTLYFLWSSLNWWAERSGIWGNSGRTLFSVTTGNLSDIHMATCFSKLFLSSINCTLFKIESSLCTSTFELRKRNKLRFNLMIDIVLVDLMI